MKENVSGCFFLNTVYIARTVASAGQSSNLMRKLSEGGDLLLTTL